MTGTNAACLYACGAGGKPGVPRSGRFFAPGLTLFLIVALVLAVFLAGVFPVPVSADEPLAAPSKTSADASSDMPSIDGPVVLYTNMDFPPYIARSMPRGGVYTDIVRSAFAASDVEVVIRSVPWKRATRLVEQGKGVATYAWGQDPDRAKRFLVSRSFFQNSWALFARRARVAGADSLSDLVAGDGEARRLCLPLGWTVPGGIGSLVERDVLKLERPATMRSCFRLLLRQRVDFVHATDLLGFYTLDQLSKRGMADKRVRDIVPFHLPPEANFEGTSHVLFADSPRGRKARALFEAGLKRLNDSGRYGRLLARHLEIYPEGQARSVMARQASAGFSVAREPDDEQSIMLEHPQSLRGRLE
ncbi:substrate-binding periplasmic protein [Yunchengibacter salinarum]|uniref:substrate-binding periplasmic protein n=1 Tax=Yunchengibacter salinarum TaxID=3133399 RepID=UPI0035B67E49